jgi:hypothetical protein
MNDRTKTVMMVFGLCHQLKNWIDHARSFGHMKHKFKQDSGLLSQQLGSFITNYGALDDEVFEHSVLVSDVFERIARMDQEDIKRLMNLMDKIESQKSYTKIDHVS